MVHIEIEPPVSLRSPIDLPWLRDRLGSALPLIGHEVQRIGVRIVGDDDMRRLHDRHLGSAEATDVLTFQLSPPGEPIDADIAVSIDEAARRSADLNHPIERELLLYVIHGLLHCSGHDDHDEHAAAAMHEEEDRILTAIGVGATFQPLAGGAKEGPRP